MQLQYGFDCYHRLIKTDLIVEGILIELSKVPEQLCNPTTPGSLKLFIYEVYLRKKAIERIVKRYYECDVVFFN